MADKEERIFIFTKQKACDICYTDENKKSDKLFFIFIISFIVIIITFFVYGCSIKNTELVKYYIEGKEIKREVIKKNISKLECVRLIERLCKEKQLHCESMKEK